MRRRDRCTIGRKRKDLKRRITEMIKTKEKRKRRG